MKGDAQVQRALDYTKRWVETLFALRPRKRRPPRWT